VEQKRKQDEIVENPFVVVKELFYYNKNKIILERIHNSGKMHPYFRRKYRIFRFAESFLKKCKIDPIFYFEKKMNIIKINKNRKLFILKNPPSIFKIG
jgi:hypothetical protein